MMATHVLWALALFTAADSDASAVARQAGYHGLICRGVEESGRLFIGQPGFGPHLISLFVTGPNPLSASDALPQHVAWVTDPAHSYVADGTGGLCIWAHPSARDAAAILALPGLTGLEVHYAGNGTARDGLWDEILTGCVEEDRPFLWGYAADDTHSIERIGLSWYAARVTSEDERSLKAALRNGAFYLSNGPSIDDVEVTGRRIALELPQESEVVWLRSGQHLAADGSPEFEVTTAPGEGRCLRWEKGVRRAGLDLDGVELPGAELRFVRAVIRTAPTTVALTQPWRVRPDGAIDNPYPANGTWIRGQTHNHTDAPPGNTQRVSAYRLAYQANGELGSFATDYSYWESPYQWLPSDGPPRILGVSPSWCVEAEGVELTVRGPNFGASPSLQLGQHGLAVTAVADGEVRARIPAGIPPGVYDLVVTTADGWRDCLAGGFVVRRRAAALLGWRNYSVADGLSYPRSTAVACFGDEVWIGSILGVSRRKDGEWTAYRDFPGRSAYAMTADPKGGVWVATGSGLVFCGPDGRMERHAVGSAEKLRRPRSPERWGRLAFDRSGSLWVANRWGAGLGVRRGGAWERLVADDGVPSDGQSAVACDAAGRLWVGFGSGLYQLVDGDWSRRDLPPDVADCRYTSAIAPGADGSVWAAVTHGSLPDRGGVVCFRGEEAVAYTPRDSPLPSARVRDVLVARDGAVWFATDVGLARLGGDGQWDVLTSVNSGLECDIVLALAEDSAGRIWLATANGASSYDPGA